MENEDIWNGLKEFIHLLNFVLLVLLVLDFFLISPENDDEQTESAEEEYNMEYEVRGQCPVCQKDVLSNQPRLKGQSKEDNELKYYHDRCVVDFCYMCNLVVLPGEGGLYAEKNDRTLFFTGPQVVFHTECAPKHFNCIR